MNSVRKFITLPNAMTLLRALLAVPLFYLIFNESTTLALIIFVIGILLDADGAVARKLGQTSQFGAVFDLIADGLFVASGIVALLIIGSLPLVFIGMLFGLNILRMLFVYLIYRRNRTITSTIWSKATGILTYILIPLGIISWQFTEGFILATIILTGIIVLKRGYDFVVLIKVKD